MIEAIGDLWTYMPADARIITTNGVVDGDAALGTQHAVMGKGVAKQARDRYKGLDSYFGLLLKERGNVPMVLVHMSFSVHPQGDCWLVTMPVKNHWLDRADLKLIEQSANLLVSLANQNKFQHLVLPRPGCGAGKRDWVSEVRPLLIDIFDDRFTVVSTTKEA